MNYINCTIDDSGYGRISADFTDRRILIIDKNYLAFEQPQEYNEALYESVIIDSDTMLEKSGLNCGDFHDSTSLCNMTAGSKQNYYESVILYFRAVRNAVDINMAELLLSLIDLKGEFNFFLKDPVYSFMLKRYEGMLEELLMFIRDPATVQNDMVHINRYIEYNTNVEGPAFIKSDLSQYTESAKDRYSKKFHGVRSKLDAFYAEGSPVSALRDSIKERYSDTCSL